MRETLNHVHFLMIGNTSSAITILLCLQLKIAQTLEGKNSRLDQRRNVKRSYGRRACQIPDHVENHMASARASQQHLFKRVDRLPDIYLTTIVQ